MTKDIPMVNVSYGITISTANKFEFERIDCSLSLPLEDVFEVQFDMMFRQVKMKVLEKGGKFGEEKEIIAVGKIGDPIFKNAETLPITEKMQQDLTNATVLGMRGDAYVIYKNGYSCYLGKSTVEGNVKIGKEQDLKLVEKFQWLVAKNKIEWKKGLLKINGEGGD